MYRIAQVSLVFISTAVVVDSFVASPVQRHHKLNRLRLVMLSEEKPTGYKFGDISKGIWKKVSGSSNEYKFGDISKLAKSKVSSTIGQVTGKPNYQLGDLSFWLDAKAKEAVGNITGKEDYEFGDLSRWVDARIKGKVNEITGEDEYRFGDLTKEIVARVSSRDYTFDDLVVLIKMLLSFGVGLSPVASFLPAKLLIELLNYSIAGDLSNRLVASLAIEIDKRIKEALTGDSEYKLGDLSQRALLQFIGKSEYTFGDVTRAVVTRLEEQADEPIPSESLVLFGAPAGSQEKAQDTRFVELDESLAAELEQMDAVIVNETLAPPKNWC